MVRLTVCLSAQEETQRLKELRQSIDKYRTTTETFVRLPRDVEAAGPAEVAQLCAVMDSMMSSIRSVVRDKDAAVKEIQTCFTVLSELWGRWITVRKDKPQLNEQLKTAAAKVRGGSQEEEKSFSRTVFTLYLQLIEVAVTDSRISRDVILPYIRVITEREKNLHLAKILLQKPSSPVYKLFVHELVLSLLSYPPEKVYKAYHLLTQSPGQTPQDHQNVLEFLTKMYPEKYEADPHGANECVIRMHFSTQRWESGTAFMSQLLNNGFYHHADTFENFLSHFYGQVLDGAAEDRSTDSEAAKKRELWVSSQLERLYPDIRSTPTAVNTWNQLFERLQQCPGLTREENDEMKKRAEEKKRESFCTTCGVNGAEKRCSSCKKATYCSKDCQSRDWKNGHKEACVQK
ncbi:pcdc2/rp-8 (programmed cell death protein 2) [Planoprotostelium fungivorum]|uniref:Pcdc2/rp-8 (Programmed cell death protein 2) n=1 Tax=Planoprotostelium fungivorum TaxID=1890364 RepID=A0A2P6NUA5_9EUKA|nr:pcdc2/rp-8 (programmed cell death protein 2) [Planoprotostelium fungivorum]